MTFDRNFFFGYLLLLFTGFILISSASLYTGDNLVGNPFHFAKRQLLYIVLSLSSFIIVLSIPIKLWHKHSGHLLLLAIGLLITVLLVGKSVNGSTRWLPLGFMNVQAAEPAKLLFFCYIAAYIHRRRAEVVGEFKGFIKPFAVLSIFSFLLLKQPDLGTVIVIYGTTLGLLFIAGAKLWQFFGIFFTGITGISLMIFFEPYRWARVTSFLDPFAEPFGSGYQLVQSLIAYGQGGYFGKGLGNSVQKLGYLPEAHTDFIMSVVAEELGFFGLSIVVLMNMFIAFKSFFIGNKCFSQNKFFDGYFAIGIGFWMAIQCSINLGASAGILPTKGLTMPFISYGGSSLITMSIALSIVLRIDYERRARDSKIANKKTIYQSSTTPNNRTS